jgi:hypothetical protein
MTKSRLHALDRASRLAPLWACATYWILALPSLLKTLGGYLLTREIGNRIAESLYSWFCLIPAISRGALPFWAGQVHAGYPVIGNPELAMLHPLSLLVFVMSSSLLINLVLFACPAVAACAMFAYGRRLGFSLLAAWLAGLIYGFNAYPAAQLYVKGSWSFALTYMCVPAVLMAGYALVKRVEVRFAGWLALATGLVLLASHVPLILLALLLLAGQTLLLFYKHKSFSWKTCGYLLLGLATGFGIAAPHLVPLAHFWRQTATAVSLGSARDYPFDRLLPEHVVSLLFPRFFGDEVNSVYWGRLSYAPLAAYAGSATVILWVCAMFYRRRIALVAAATAGLLAALFLAAEVAPLFGSLCSLPGWLQAAESPAVFLSGFPLFAALLAGAGWESVMSMTPRMRKRTGQGIVLFTVIAVALGWLYFARSGGGGFYWSHLVTSLIQDPMTSLSPELVERISGSEQFREACYIVAQDSVTRSLAFIGAFGLLLIFGFSAADRPRSAAPALIALLFATDVVAFFHSLESILPEDMLRLPPAAVAYLKEHGGQNYRAMAPFEPELCALPPRHGLNSVWQRTPFVYKDYLALLRLQERQPTFYAPGLMVTRLTPLTRSLGVNTILTRPSSRYNDPGCTVTLQTGGVALYSVIEPVLPRAWIPEDVSLTTQSQAALLNVSSLTWQPEKTAYVDGATLNVPSGRQPCLGTTATVSRQTSREIVITLSRETTASCVLVLADVFDPWWKVTAEGKPAVTGKANYAFRGIVLPAGTREVKLDYVIPHWALLFDVASVSLGLTLVLLILRPRKTIVAAAGKGNSAE